MFQGKTLKVDMSPMIDLVFLLLIFFMVSSTLITFRKDPDGKIPIATAETKKGGAGRAVGGMEAARLRGVRRTWRGATAAGFWTCRKGLSKR